MFEWIEDGGIASAQGFSAGGVNTGVKTYGEQPRLDLGLLASDRPCEAAGVFTRSSIPGAPVLVSREHLSDGRAQALVVNSGCSNVAMGEQGMRDARAMAALAAEKLGIDARDVLVGSTGVIGRPLPMERIGAGIAEVTPAAGAPGGVAFARSIMTTDTVHKQRAARFRLGEHTYTVGGVAKGSGMVHPDMATVFCFLTTDAPVEIGLLRSMLREVADVSINMVDVDMDTSTSDTMLLLANGAAGGEPIDAQHAGAQALRGAVEAVAIALARELARDGEGARTLIEVEVAGAATQEDARLAARTISSSPLVKTMITGRDPNLGRVMMALGRSGAAVEVERTSVFIGGSCAFRSGVPSDVDYAALSKEMDAAEVSIRVDLGLGEASATAWGCDLTEGYVRINADYTT